MISSNYKQYWYNTFITILLSIHYLSFHHSIQISFMVNHQIQWYHIVFITSRIQLIPFIIISIKPYSTNLLSNTTINRLYFISHHMDTIFINSLFSFVDELITYSYSNIILSIPYSRNIFLFINIINDIFIIYYSFHSIINEFDSTFHILIIEQYWESWINWSVIVSSFNS